jgi:peptidoglycan/xylan/chitin deacetylase (PgdA/CDA1 family)
MSLGPEHLEYPRRRHGMDHDRYAWAITQRRPIEWPNGARVALWIVAHLEWFPLDGPKKPFPVPGGMTTTYPDLRHYSLRDYGNRVGVYRVLEVLAKYGLRASFATNAAIAERYPTLLRDVASAGHEIVGHGVDMGHVHHGGLSPETEEAWIRRSLAILRAASGQGVEGWISPALSESHATPDLLAAHGVRWTGDFINDDLPYPMQVAKGSLHALPYKHLPSDLQVLFQYKQTEQDWIDQLVDQFDVLHRESGTPLGGRVVPIVIHPWIIGQPHRIHALEAALDHIIGTSGAAHAGVWNATGAEILDAFEKV